MVVIIFPVYVQNENVRWLTIKMEVLDWQDNTVQKQKKMFRFKWDGYFHRKYYINIDCTLG